MGLEKNHFRVKYLHRIEKESKDISNKNKNYDLSIKDNFIHVPVYLTSLHSIFTSHKVCSKFIAFEYSRYECMRGVQ